MIAGASGGRVEADWIRHGREALSERGEGMRASYVILASVIVLGLEAVAAGQPSAGILAAYVARGESGRPRAIAGCKSQLKELRIVLARAKRGRIAKGQDGVRIDAKSRRMTFPSKTVKKQDVQSRIEAVERAEESLAALEDGRAMYLAEMPMAPPAVGQIGRLHDPRARVEQVIDGRNARIRVVWATGCRMRSVRGQPVRDLSERHYYLWLRNYPTTGMADNAMVDLDGVFWVAGTKSYTNVLGGTKTIFVIEHVPSELITEAYKKGGVK